MRTEAPQKGTLHAWARTPAGDRSWSMLSLVALDGTLRQGSKVDHAIAEAAAREAAQLEVSRFEYRTVKWNGFDLEVMVTHASTPDAKVALWAVQVPLATGGVQVQLVGDAADETKLSAEFDDLVHSVKGQTNWGAMTINEARQLGRRVGVVIGACGCPLCGVAGIGLLVWLLVRKKQPRKTP